MEPKAGVERGAVAGSAEVEKAVAEMVAARVVVKAAERGAVGSAEEGSAADSEED